MVLQCQHVDALSDCHRATGQWGHAMTLPIALSYPWTEPKWPHAGTRTGYSPAQAQMPITGDLGPQFWMMTHRLQFEGVTVRGDPSVLGLNHLGPAPTCITLPCKALGSKVDSEQLRENLSPRNESQ